MLKLKSLLLITLVVHTAETVWVNEDFWTAISPANTLSSGRTIADFARIDNDDIFPALWITRARYPGNFESFGFAYVRPDGKVCGWFAGYDAEAVEVCGGFRVLSVPERFRGQKIFEWVPATAGVEGTVGFSSHRIARRIAPDGNVTYGDAKHSAQSFFGVQKYPESGPEVVVERHADFLERVSLLRLLVDPRSHEDRFRNFRRSETASVLPPRENVNVQGSAQRMYIPVDIVRNEKGELFERKIVDDRLFFMPFDVVEKRAMTVEQILNRHGAHKVHGKRRRSVLKEAPPA